ncbi:MAG: phosphatidylinositol transfer protein [Proteobacteria bacterium]|nr:MAG: phosphatidylinositol transfer protein [Pseudomonadota bacterium]
MKRNLLLAVFVFTVTFQMACGPVSQSPSEVAGSVNGCNVAPFTDTTLPRLPKPVGFELTFDSPFYRGGAIHRARDVIALKSHDAILHAKFAYKFLDKDMKGVPVDVYLSQGCRSTFKKIGTVVTSRDDENGTVENVRDSGGRIFAKLSSFGVKNLPVGRHRLLYVVPADNSFTESFIDVVDAQTKYVVSDIDGTLTSSEMAAAVHLLNLSPSAHPGAAQALGALAKNGYKIFYLTARPEWLMPATRQWLSDKNFPAGTIHTTDSKVGAQGEAAKNYKINEISLFTDQTGIVPSYAFGNKPSDVEAFGKSGIPAFNSYYYKLGSDAQGGVIHSDYTKLIASFNKSVNVSH